MVAENKDEEFSQQNLQDMLKIYYKRLFPRQVFYRWLTYSHSKFIRNVICGISVLLQRRFGN